MAKLATHLSGLARHAPRFINACAANARTRSVDETGSLGVLVSSLTVGSTSDGLPAGDCLSRRRSWRARRPSRSGEFLHRSQTAPYAADDCFCMKASPLRQVRRGVRNTVDDYSGSPALITGLSSLRGPQAILRRIVAIRIGAIKRVSRSRFLPHVGHKVCECFPAFANGDTPPAIVAEVVDMRVVAPRKDASPSSVERMLRDAHVALSKSRQSSITSDEGTQS